MATLWIAVFDAANEVLFDAPIQEIKVSISGTSAQSAAISGSGKIMRRVRLFTDTDCFVTWDDDPTALQDGSDGRPLGAENPEVFGIVSGEKIATIERV